MHLQMKVEKNKDWKEIMNVRMEDGVRKRAKKGLNAGP